MSNHQSCMLLIDGKIERTLKCYTGTVSLRCEVPLILLIRYQCWAPYRAERKCLQIIYCDRIDPLASFLFSIFNDRRGEVCKVQVCLACPSQAPRDAAWNVTVWPPLAITRPVVSLADIFCTYEGSQLHMLQALGCVAADFCYAPELRQKKQRNVAVWPNAMSIVTTIMAVLLAPTMSQLSDMPPAAPMSEVESPEQLQRGKLRPPHGPQRKQRSKKNNKVNKVSNCCRSHGDPGNTAGIPSLMELIIKGLDPVPVPVSSIARTSFWEDVKEEGTELCCCAPHSITVFECRGAGCAVGTGLCCWVQRAPPPLLSSPCQVIWDWGWGSGGGGGGITLLTGGGMGWDGSVSNTCQAHSQADYSYRLAVSQVAPRWTRSHTNHHRPSPRLAQ